MDAMSIIKIVTAVTKKWAKQRKAEERSASNAARREAALRRSHRATIRDAAWEVMPAAYLKASSNNQYPAHARQIMYAARGAIQQMTGQPLDDQYFCQKILPDYLKEHEAETSGWDVAFDARGHLVEPFTGRSVPLGTLDVRAYLAQVEGVRSACWEEAPATSRVRGLFPTCGPGHRFGAIMFIEKEGFLPLFRAVRLAERYDVAIMSTKGLPVVESRRLVDRLCGRFSIPLLVLHDFDKSGFSIVGTLCRTTTRRYAFENEIQVVDLGLRLKDVEAWGLEPEDVFYGKSDPRNNLRKNGATSQEIAFLCDAPWGHMYHGRRVELNGFSSGDFVRWIEGKLQQPGIRKVMPGADVLGQAYRRAAEAKIVRGQVEEVVRQARARAQQLDVPPALGEQVRQRLLANPGLAWDQAVQAVVEEQLL
jgi:hypothetical protein